MKDWSEKNRESPEVKFIELLGNGTKMKKYKFNGEELNHR